MSDETTQAGRQPGAQVRALDRLVGTWEVSGGASGTITYEWMAGGFFLLQHIELRQDGQHILGMEVIGHLYNPFADETPSEDVKSRFYDDHGNTLDYTYELDGDTLTIWGGEKGSPRLYVRHLQRRWRQHPQHLGLSRWRWLQVHDDPHRPLTRYFQDTVDSIAGRVMLSGSSASTFSRLPLRKKWLSSPSARCDCVEETLRGQRAYVHRRDVGFVE